MKKFSLRRLICAALAGTLLAASLAGCSGQGTGSTGKTVVIGAATDLKTLDPGHAYEVYANMITYATYDMLFRIEGSDIENPKPSLTTDAWSLDDSRTVYTFPLREGVKFASGNELTSADVVWSIKRVMNLKSNTAAHVAGINSVEAPDAKTVKITLKEPDASFLTKLASNAFCVLDSKLMKENGGTDAEDAASTDKGQAYLDKQSAGSGPFKLTSWVKGSELVLEKNPNYWGTSTNVEKIILKEIPDSNTQIQMLDKGEIDIALTLNADNIAQLKGKNNVEIKTASTAVCTFLLMNNDSKIGGPMANADVQQAVRLAIDYQGLKTMCGEGATLPWSIVPQGFVGAKNRPDNYQNVEKAKELMKKAGYEKGFEITLTAANFDTEGMKWGDIGQKIQNDLKQIGITVKLETPEFSNILDQYRNGEIPFLLMHWSPDYYDINNQLAFLPGDTVGERAKWSAEGHDDLIELGNKIIGEADKEKRTQYSQELQDKMAENSPYAFLLQHPKTFAVSKTLNNVAYNDLSKIQLTEISIAE